MGELVQSTIQTYLTFIDMSNFPSRKVPNDEEQIISKDGFQNENKTNIRYHNIFFVNIIS